MASKKTPASLQDAIKALIEEHPTWSDAQIHAEFKAAGKTPAFHPSVVSDTRAELAAAKAKES